MKNPTFVLCAVVCLSGAVAASAEAEDADYEQAIAAVKALAQSEIDRGLVHGFSIALVDDQKLVYAGGFGLANPKKRIAATADTIYRAGSVSKLFNAIAVMQQVEAGQLDLDAPVRKYEPRFAPTVPWADAAEVTLRNMLCHRSGLIRESPVGSYFDPDEPSVEETVLSVNESVLVNRPNTVTRYSNVGPTVAGHLVSRVTNEDFETYQQQRVLGPLGMKSSTFVKKKLDDDRMSVGMMRIADGKGGFTLQPAPLFDLGTIPAGNLFTTAPDLGKFASCLLAEGKMTDGTALVRSDTLKEMVTPQLQQTQTGFGLAFSVGTYRGYRTIGHNGAVYGHSTAFIVLPEQKIAVILLCSEDISMGPVYRVANGAIDLMLQAKHGIALPEQPKAADLSPHLLEGLTDEYESEGYWANLQVRDGKLIANIATQEMTLTPTDENNFLAYGAYVNNSAVSFQRDASGKAESFSALGQKFVRVDPAMVPEPPAYWKDLCGSYGPKFIPLVVYVRNGHLYATTENMVDYRLTPVTPTVFRMAPGLYTDEYAVFQLKSNGKAQSVVISGMTLKRR